MIEPERIPPEEARNRVSSGVAIFVCAYDDEEKFRKMHLEGGTSYNRFKGMIASLSRDQEIIFY
jgi:hypothetical protein